MLNRACAIISVVFSKLLIMPRYYYAVGRGRKVGVFDTWSECQQQVVKISNAQFRKFDSLQKAWEFVRECQVKYSPYKSPGKTNLSQSEPTRSTSPSLLSTTSVSAPSFIKVLEKGVSNLNTKNGDIKSSKSVANQVRCESNDRTEVVQSLQNRLKRVEEQHDEVTQRVNVELQQVKTKCEALSNVSVEIKSVLEKLSLLENEFKISYFALKAEVNKINADILSLKAGCDLKSNSVASSSSSIRKNLSQFLTAVEPVSQKRKFSSSQLPFGSSSHNAVDGPSRSVLDDDDEDTVIIVPVPPKKVVKIELSDSEDESQYEFNFDNEGYAIVYTDGACEQNGRRGAKAGIGVWFSDNHPLNCSEPVQGRPTNNTAEIQAAVHAIEVAKRAGLKKLLVNTDSKFLISCITQWIYKWKKNNWTLINGGPVKNKEDLISLDNAMKGINVKWNHVRGHQGIHGNEMADRLARNGAERYGMSQ